MSVKAVTGQPEMLEFVDDYSRKTKIAVTTDAKVRDVFAAMDRELLKTHPSGPRYHFRLHFASDLAKRSISTYDWKNVSRIKDVGPAELLSVEESETFLSLPAATFTKDGRGVIAWMSYDKLPPRDKPPQDIKAN